MAWFRFGSGSELADFGKAAQGPVSSRAICLIFSLPPTARARLSQSRATSSCRNWQAYKTDWKGMVGSLGTCQMPAAGLPSFLDTAIWNPAQSIGLVQPARRAFGRGAPGLGRFAVPRPSASPAPRWTSAIPARPVLLLGRADLRQLRPGFRQVAQLQPANGGKEAVCVGGSSLCIAG